MNDVVVNKVQSIQRCVKRARDDHRNAGDSFATDFLHQDAAILNVVRACETAIDLANHVIRDRKLGIPTSTAEAFRLLQSARLIDSPLCERLVKMVGFRNTAIHQYTKLDIKIVEAVITRGLDDLLAFAEAMRKEMT
ncbi:MAG: DUF86 domain-containing protein [SAR202 cluster bacterium]|nr:DUF86 domain-containing protein [SAR202 cluster bacterium]